MKKIAFCTLSLALFLFNSCDLFKLDNYKAPSETLQGEIVDMNGNPVLTDQGSEGIRVRLWELSYWAQEHLNHNPPFYCRPDGTFQNTKLFPGIYEVEVDGPFIPLKRRHSLTGNMIADETQTVEIRNGRTAKVKYEVQPFLNVEWIGEPMVSNGRILANVRVTRAVSINDFRDKIQPMGDYRSDFTNMTDLQLFVSYSSSVGYRARDTRWSTGIPYSGADFQLLFGEPISIQSTSIIPSGRTVFIRAAARINYATGGVRRYNYSEVKEVPIP